MISCRLGKSLVYVTTLALVAAMPGAPALATARPAGVMASPQTVTISGSAAYVTPLSDTSLFVLDSEMFSHLAVYDGRGHLQPDLLAALPTEANRGVLDNGRTIILRLKRHQYWSSGVEITSTDLVFGWKVLLDGGESPPCTDGRCKLIDSVMATGRYTVRLRLKHPYAQLLPDYLPPLVPHSSHRLGGNPHTAALKLYGASAWDYLYTSAWTNGPYRIKQLDPSSGRAVLTRMKYYRVHPGPFFRQLVISPQKTADLVAAVMGGQVDVAAFDRPSSLVPILSHPGAYTVLLSPTFDAPTLEFNVLDPVVNGHTNPVHDVRVRQALSLALDRVALTEGALNVGRDVARRLVAYTPYLVSPYTTETGVSRAVTGAWDPLVRRYVPYGSQAIRDARRLLAAAGYGGGLQIDVLATAAGSKPAPWFDVIKRDWAAIGVQVGTSIYPGAPLGECTGSIIAAGQFEVFLTSEYGGPNPDELSYSLDSRFVARFSQDRDPRLCNGDFNYSGVQDPTVDQGLRRGAATYDPSQRGHWYGQVQERVAKQAYWAPLFYQPNVVIANRHLRGVTGYPLAGTMALDAGYPWNAYSWRYMS